jgi:DNA-binding transcriptional ArsR family regulator
VERGIADLAKALAALGSVERIHILSYLLAQGGSPCGRIAHALGMSTSAFSYHLRILEDAGLVTRNRRGRLHCLSLTPILDELLAPGIRQTLTKEGEQWISKSSTK